MIRTHWRHAWLAHRRSSARQRIVVLTFPTAEEADAWDAAGQPLHLHDFPTPVAVATIANHGDPDRRRTEQKAQAQRRWPDDTTPTRTTA